MQKRLFCLKSLSKSLVIKWEVGFAWLFSSLRSVTRIFDLSTLRVWWVRDWRAVPQLLHLLFSVLTLFANFLLWWRLIASKISSPTSQWSCHISGLSRALLSKIDTQGKRIISNSYTVDVIPVCEHIGKSILDVAFIRQYVNTNGRLQKKNIHISLLVVITKICGNFQ